MPKAVRRLLLLVVLINFGCGAPRSAQSPADPATAAPEAPAPAPVFQETPAVPTVTAIPDKTYEPLHAVINESNGKKTEIALGKAILSQTKFVYRDPNGKMRLRGHVSILNDKQEQIVEKDFAITGSSQPGAILTDLTIDELEGQGEVTVRGKAVCDGTDAENQTDCSHIVVDVFIKYAGKYYTDQLQATVKPADKSAPEPSQTQPAPAPSTPAPAEPQVTPQPPEIPVTTSVTSEPEEAVPTAGEPEADPEDLQGEDDDQSIDGRFEGTAASVNLDELFTAPAATDSGETKPTVQSQTVTSDIEKTERGELRPRNQAQGYPNSGKLRNATSLLSRQNGLKDLARFEVSAPGRNRHFGTYELAEMVVRAGQEMTRIYDRKLFLSSVSDLDGGKLAPHKSHQMGVDADIAYPAISPNVKFPLVVSKKPRRFYTHNYSTRATFEMFQFLFRQDDIKVDRIFVDQHIINELCSYAKKRNMFAGEQKQELRYMFQNLQHIDGHGDHFHLRLKCSKSDPACRSRIYRRMNSCG